MARAFSVFCAIVVLTCGVGIGSWIAYRGDSLAGASVSEVWDSAKIVANGFANDARLRYDELSFQVAPMFEELRGNASISLTRASDAASRYAEQAHEVLGSCKNLVRERVAGLFSAVEERRAAWFDDVRNMSSKLPDFATRPLNATRIFLDSWREVVEVNVSQMRSWLTPSSQTLEAHLRYLQLGDIPGVSATVAALALGLSAALVALALRGWCLRRRGRRDACDHSTISAPSLTSRCVQVSPPIQPVAEQPIPQMMTPSPVSASPLRALARALGSPLRTVGSQEVQQLPRPTSAQPSKRRSRVESPPPRDEKQQEVNSAAHDGEQTLLNILNVGDENDLLALNGIGEKSVGRILSYRQRHGPLVRATELYSKVGLNQAICNKVMKQHGVA